MGEIEEEIARAFATPTTRVIRMWTGIGGKDQFDIAIENRIGLYRVRIGKKVPRILRTLKTPIRKSIVGYYYKLLKYGKTT